MTHPNSDTPVASNTCANCDAALGGDYCAQCGQSRSALQRPFLTLLTEALDGVLNWDGRLMTTFRRLFARPGKIARAYIDGKRQSHTPPLRLYLVVSLVFFALMEVSGVRIVAVDSSVDESGDPNVAVTMFQRPRDGDAHVMTPEEQAIVLEGAREADISGPVERIVRRAMTAPEAVEQQAASSASQAMILMVFVFALLSGLFHPRRPIIEHAVHALYFHAALLLPFAGFILLGIYIPGLPIWGAVALALTALFSMSAGFVLFDRGFYGSSWIGAILRSIPIMLGYVTGAVFVAIGLILLGGL